MHFGIKMHNGGRFHRIVSESALDHLLTPATAPCHHKIALSSNIFLQVKFQPAKSVKFDWQDLITGRGSDESK